eukprot:gnl/MRDRNA2_/MRDRNA2_99059_c0_seq1.p1 gnl/MRDRNA2_/MRDRNA2_99059_c0~~gnl/MRDRNA2_/MRDRNA2_99059_c0_seq1.p1  ORF type:complete len:817 (+),score=218.38 gnl/MRDRNA2_/MRDRNA2_99059_c0_seq1:81-2531(+)
MTTEIIVIIAASAVVALILILATWWFCHARLNARKMMRVSASELKFEVDGACQEEVAMDTVGEDEVDAASSLQAAGSGYQMQEKRRRASGTPAKGRGRGSPPAAAEAAEEERRRAKEEESRTRGEEQREEERAREQEQERRRAEQEEKRRARERLNVELRALERAREEERRREQEERSREADTLISEAGMERAACGGIEADLGSQEKGYALFMERAESGSIEEDVGNQEKSYALVMERAESDGIEEMLEGSGDTFGIASSDQLHFPGQPDTDLSRTAKCGALSRFDSFEAEALDDGQALNQSGFDLAANLQVEISSRVMAGASIRSAGVRLADEEFGASMTPHDLDEKIPIQRPGYDAAQDDLVEWTPFAPKAIRHGDYFQIDIWAALRKDKKLVQALNEITDDDRNHRLVEGMGHVAYSRRGQTWLVKLDLPHGLEVESNIDDVGWLLTEEQVTWLGRPALAHFECRCTDSAQLGVAKCCAYVKHAEKGEVIARVDFEILVESLYDICMQMVEAVKSKYPTDLSKIYDVSAKVDDLYTLIRDSVKLYREALRKIRWANRTSVNQLLELESKDLYCNFEDPSAAPRLTTKRDAWTWKLMQIEPKQSARNQHELMSDSRVAQKLLKQLIAPGSEWASTDLGPGRESGAGHIRQSEDGNWSCGLKDFVEEAFDPGVKSVSGVERKVHGKYNGDYSRLRDVSRLSVLFSTPEALLEALIKFEEAHPFVKLENRFHDPTSLGWMDVTVLIQLQVDSGHHISEVQMQLKDFAEARHEAHLLYEKIRVMLPIELGVEAKDVDNVIEAMLEAIRGGSTGLVLN